MVTRPQIFPGWGMTFRTETVNTLPLEVSFPLYCQQSPFLVLSSSAHGSFPCGLHFSQIKKSVLPPCLCHQPAIALSPQTLSKEYHSWCQNSPLSMPGIFIPLSPSPPVTELFLAHFFSEAAYFHSAQPRVPVRKTARSLVTISSQCLLSTPPPQALFP